MLLTESPSPRPHCWPVSVPRAGLLHKRSSLCRCWRGASGPFGLPAPHRSFVEPSPVSVSQRVPAYVWSKSGAYAGFGDVLPLNPVWVIGQGSRLVRRSPHPIGFRVEIGLPLPLTQERNQCRVEWQRPRAVLGFDLPRPRI